LFCLPGIYLALTGLGAGGGGPDAQQVASTAIAILQGVFTLSGWMGGAVLNLLRPKITLMLGGVGYPIYVAGLWYFDRVGHAWFPYLGGALLGLSAGCLWTSAGFIQFAYAQEDEKAMVSRYFMHNKLRNRANSASSLHGNGFSPPLAVRWARSSLSVSTSMKPLRLEFPTQFMQLCKFP
jgi:hypothetical protein